MKRLFTNLILVGAMLVTASTAQAQIFAEDFEGTTGTTIPGTWTQVSAASDGGWKSGTAATLSSTSMPFPTHGRFLGTNDDGCGQTCNKSSDLLKSPAFSLTGVTGAYLSFAYLFYDGTYQGLNEDFIVKISTDGGANWTTLQSMTGEDDWTTAYLSLAAYNNQASVMIGFEYKDNTGWLFGAGIDDVRVYVPAAVDVVLTAVTPAPGALSAYGLPGTNVTFGGTVFNEGSQTITSIIVAYTVDGGAPVSQTLTVNIAPFTFYDFTITPAYSLTLGNHTVTIGAVVVGDASAGNDLLTTSVGGAEFMPTHTVTFEEGTGTWCGWCPRGAVYMDSIKYEMGNNVVAIAVHNSSTDPMTLTAYDNGVSSMIGGYPSVLVDRKVEVDPSDVFTAYDDYADDFGFANLTVTKSYNNATRSITVDASANFAVELTGDYRLALVLTEDGVHGTTSGYNQVNYYSSASQNQPLSGSGHNWQSEPNPVPAATMYYNFVARYISGGFNGLASSLPATIPSGSTQTHTFTTTLPASWSDWNMQAHVLLIDATNSRILNAVNVPGMVNGVNDVASSIDRISLYPNPTENTLNVLFSIKSQQNVSIELTDILGKVVSSHSYKNVAAGVNQVALNTSDLANGIYFANIKTNDGSISRKFIKQ